MQKFINLLLLQKEHCLFTTETDFDVSIAADSCHYDISNLSHLVPNKSSEVNIVTKLIQGRNPNHPQYCVC